MRKIYFLLILFIATACSNDDSTENSSQLTEVETIEIGKGFLSGANGEKAVPAANIIVTNDDNWQVLLNQLDETNNVSAGFSETEIDFETYMLIGIFKEVKMTSWDVEISNIVEDENNLIISVEETEGDAAVVGQPFYIVKIPVSEKELIFE